MDRKKIIVLMCLIASITALHYLTSVTRTPLHILYRELYFIPIVLGGLWGGKRFGLIVSISITVLYLPHVFILARLQSNLHHDMMINTFASVADTYWGNVFQILIFNLAGFFSGAYADLKQGYYKTTAQDYQPIRFKKDFLLFVEESQSTLYAAKYFADMFGNASDVGVTLFWVSSAANRDYSETNRETPEDEKELLRKGEILLNRVKDILTSGGINENRIQMRSLAGTKNRKISEKILEHLREGNYDTIVVGKHNMSKSQEFVFGSVAVNLVRKSPINVLTVKVPDEEASS
jgi:nucleotide-binding universal stress UspA family protein